MKALRAIGSIYKSAAIRRRNYVVAQIHGPLFQQLEQITFAGALAEKTGRRLAIDCSLYRFYESSPHLLTFIDVVCERVNLSDITLRRRHDPALLRRADWRRAIKAMFGPTMLGYHELDQMPERGTIVLHGFPGFGLTAALGPVAPDVLKRRNPSIAERSGCLIFSGTLAHDCRVRFESDSGKEIVFLTEKRFAQHFFAIVNCAHLRTNNLECEFWLNVFANKDSRIEFDGSA